MLLSRRLLWCVGLSLSLTLSLIALSTATVSSTSSSESVQWVDAILLEESTKPSLASNSESSMVHNGEVAPEATVGTLGQANADDVNNAATELTPPIAPNPSDFNRQAQYAHPFFPDEHWRRSVYGLRRRRVPYGRYKDQYGSINPYRNPNNDRTVPEDMVQPRNRLDVAMNPKLTDFGKESHMKFGSKQEPPRGGFSSVKLHEERWHLAQPMYQQNWMQTYPYNSGNYNPFRNHLLPVDYKVPEHLDFSDFSLAAAYPAALGGIVYGSPSMIYGTTGYPFTSPSQPHGSASGVPYGPSVMGQSLLNKFHELAQAGGEVNNLASNAVKQPTTVAPAKKEGETTEEKKEE